MYLEHGHWRWTDNPAQMMRAEGGLYPRLCLRPSKAWAETQAERQGRTICIPVSERLEKRFGDKAVLPGLAAWIKRWLLVPNSANSLVTVEDDSETVLSVVSY